jgi:hypothetical protein
MQITLDLPDNLAQKLQLLGDRLPTALDQALQGFLLDETTLGQGERQIIDLLASQPSPEEVLAIRPSEVLQTRVSELLERNKANGLSREEEADFDRYMLLEHWVRMAKINAQAQSESSSSIRSIEGLIEREQLIENGEYPPIA